VKDEPRGATQKPYRVSRCLLCGYTAIDAHVDGRFVTTSCPSCLAVLAIEFDPVDQPGLRARIERIIEPEEI
jgi:rubrerythrin